jgi:tRNA(Ile)-lysidine synthase TilS/MesJ
VRYHLRHTSSFDGILYYTGRAEPIQGRREAGRTDRKILGQIRRAVDDYGMIGPGDRIAVGVSGGKDSLTLLCGLAKLRDFHPNRFELEAVTIDAGIGVLDAAPIAALCERLGVRFTLEKTDIGPIVFDKRNESNPCAMCANLRRGALNDVAARLGCNKLALAHNRDDAVETLLMALFYEGRIHTFAPVTHFTRREITMIRPLIYVWEKDVRGFVKSHGLTVVKNECPMNGRSTRQKVKELLAELSREKRDLKAGIAGAIVRAGLDGWTPIDRGPSGKGRKTPSAGPGST